MLSFKKVALNDIKTIKPYFYLSTNKTCDNTMGGTYMWRDYFSVEYAIQNETLIFKVKVKYHNGINAFTLPIGKDIYGTIMEIEKFCRYAEIPIAFCTVTEEELTLLTTIFNDTRIYKEDNWSDYLYRVNDIVNLVGRKYSGQRNHINAFKRAYENYSFEEITKRNVNEVKDFYTYLNLTTNKKSDVFIEEQTKTFEVLDNYNLYGMIGGILRVNGAIAAFSIGEIYNNVLFIHIEKADLKYRGVSQVINNEFAKYYASSVVEYVNREEDVGDEGLRASKQSYHPCEIISKYLVVVNKNEYVSNEKD